jgi:hypothetical protein
MPFRAVDCDAVETQTVTSSIDSRRNLSCPKLTPHGLGTVPKQNGPSRAHRAGSHGQTVMIVGDEKALVTVAEKMLAELGCEFPTIRPSAQPALRAMRMNGKHFCRSRSTTRAILWRPCETFPS